MEKEVILSHRVKLAIQNILKDIKKDLKTEMEISGLTDLRINIHCSINQSMPFMGVKINASKLQQEEFIYDDK
ncbi:hypothetical protein [Bdellovibrio sp. HCB288]|uniref:hypothetical protein n=1 Tax=Bdellovibrio sp. HCB288 TaxID=3394355 RepID=UPI0039B46DD9